MLPPCVKLMKWRNYIDEDLSVYSGKAHELLSSIDMSSYDGWEEFGVALILRQLPALLWVCEGDLVGKKIIDLGCGSRGNELAHYEPWLCRFLFECGIDVVGVDLVDCDEKFPFVKEDVFLDELNFEGDIIHAASLFDSPRLLQKYGLDAGEKLKKKILNEVEAKFFLYS